MMLQDVGYTISVVRWSDHQRELATIRQQVFVEEQHVPEVLEWDGLDAAATHALAVDMEHCPIGCGRLLAEGKIGRMAVLPEWRGKGIGWSLLQTLLQIARQQELTEVTLSAQVYAIPFYHKAGFIVCSTTYSDAGIPHRDMQLKFSAQAEA